MFRRRRVCSSVPCFFSAKFPASCRRPLPRDVLDAATFIESASKAERLQVWADAWALVTKIKEWSTDHPCLEQWRASAHPDIAPITQGFDPLFLTAVAGIVGVDASSLVYLFKCGFPIVGAFAAPGVFSDPPVSTEMLSIDKLFETANERWSELPGVLCVRAGRRGTLERGHD